MFKQNRVSAHDQPKMILIISFIIDGMSY